MRIIPIAHNLDLAVSHGHRSPGLHMSDIYNDLYQDLEPKRYVRGSPMDLLRLEAGMAFEDILEEGLKRRLVERPGEFVTDEGILYSPDCIIFNGSTRLGELKLTWMSSKEVPRVEANGFPPKFDKYFCVAPETPILLDDLSYVAAGDLQIGQRLFGFDEFCPPGLRQRRHFRPAEILAVQRVVKPSVHLFFADGDVVCSADHQWLASTGGQNPTWLYSAELLRDDRRISSQSGGRKRTQHCELLRVMPPSWSTQLTDHERGYLAGIFDGEGSFSINDKYGTVRLTVSQRPGPVLLEIERLLRKDGYAFQTRKASTSGLGRGDCISLVLNRNAEVLRLLATIRPLRLLAKLKQQTRLTDFRYSRVPILGREDMGQQEVVAIETTSHTYIAGGLASHNCQMKAYCYHLHTRDARLMAFFVNGDYKPPKPELLAWDIEFSQRELEDNWTMLLNHAKHKRLL